MKGGGVPADLAVFADGTDGFLLDMAKLDTTYVENTGVTPAITAGQSIGLALDVHSWQGRTLAQELAQGTELLVASPLNGTLYPLSVLTVSGSSIVLAQRGAGVGGAYWDLGQAFPAGSVIAVRLPLTINSGNAPRSQLVLTDNGASTWRSGATVLAAGANAMHLVVTGGSSRYLEVSIATPPVDFSILEPSAKRIPGNAGSQATSGARGVRQAGAWRGDGIDDAILTNLILGVSAFALMVRVSLNALTGTSTVLLGTKDAANGRAAIRLNGGVLGGDVGSQDPSTIKGGGDVRGTAFTAALVATGSEVTLYRDNTVLYNGPQVGGGASAVQPVHIGILNNNGTVGGNYLNGDLFKALAIKKALTASEIQAITNQWGTA